MKFSKLNSAFSFLLILLYGNFSTPAIANTLVSEEDEFNFRSSENLQTDHNKSLIFFQEFSSELSQEIMRYSPLDSGFFSKFQEFKFLSKRNSEEYNSWAYLQDIKSLIKNQIFPFHVFW